MSLHKEDRKYLRMLRSEGVLERVPNGKLPPGILVACVDDYTVANLLEKYGTFRPLKGEVITVTGGVGNQLTREETRAALLRHIEESLAALGTEHLAFMSDFPCRQKRFWSLKDVVALLVKAERRVRRNLGELNIALAIHIDHGSRVLTYAVHSRVWERLEEKIAAREAAARR